MDDTMILTNEKLIDRRVANTERRIARVVLGNGRDNKRRGNLEFSPGTEFTSKVRNWANSAARDELYRNMKALSDKIAETEKNASPSPADLMTYLEYVHIDLVRLSEDNADYSSFIYNVISRPDATDPTKLRDLIPYVGKKEVISGENDSVPMIEENNAQGASVNLDFKAFGHKSSIRNLVMNPNATTQRILEAAATIDIDSRNNDIIGHLVGLTYPAKQTQAFDSTGSTRDEKLYNTVVAAIKKLAALKHPLTGQLLSGIGAFSGGLRILAHPADAWELERVIRGQLEGKGGTAANRSRLPIADIIPYGGGVMNGLTWAGKTLSLPGVALGTAYLYMPNRLAGFVIDKIAQTMETGSGSVLQLSTEERAWYSVNGLHHSFFTGGAETNTDSGEGCIVKFATA